MGPGLALLWLLMAGQPASGEDRCPGLYHWRCGDTCLSGSFKCHCGEDEFNNDDGKWCCHSGPCTARDWRDVTCPGAALLLNQTCRGGCNFFPEDKERSSYGKGRSHVPCKDANECVPENVGRSSDQSVCHGEARCRDKGDLAWCREQRRTGEECPGYGLRCNKTGGLPGQCIAPAKEGDGEYDCLDRSKEDPYTDSRTSHSAVDLSQLQSCKDEYSQQPGLKCSGSEGDTTISMSKLQSFPPPSS